MKIKLLILDVDGVMTDGKKTYNKDHEVLSKSFLCKDFTAIKRFIASGVKVIMLSGDAFNEKMAIKRNIDFYCSRGDDLSLDKSRFVALFQNKYKANPEEMAFVGDDYFDLSMFKTIKSFATSDAPQIIKQNSFKVLKSSGGNGVIVELYDLFVEMSWITDATEAEVSRLDKLEATSQEMS
jgi:3-deoxy-D-manno-octulosonate 8-phosphate phosphatase (KDO 8-P phosphatase)